MPERANPPRPSANAGPEEFPAGKGNASAGDTSAAGTICADHPEVLTEHLSEDWGTFVRSSQVLAQFQSSLQIVEVHDTTAFGRLFRLDGHFMTSEKDEFFYHENLVHMAALAHPDPQRALIIGGGDGGSAEELLKYPSMQSVILCEIDRAVIEVSRSYFGAVHRGALDDPRVDVVIGDGLAFMRDTSERFDLIVLDLTDPGGPSTDLYTPAFYRDCAARLAVGGAMTLHIASPVAHPARIRRGLADLKSAFPIVRPYLTAIPLYGGMWMMACVSVSLDPAELTASEAERRISARRIGDLQYYNGAMHCSALALPNFVRELTNG